MKIKLIAVIFMILFLISISYIAYDKVSESFEKKYQVGYVQGNNDTINSIIDIVSKCESIEVDLSNGYKLNLVAYECFEKTNGN